MNLYHPPIVGATGYARCQAFNVSLTSSAVWLIFSDIGSIDRVTIDRSPAAETDRLKWAEGQPRFGSSETGEILAREKSRARVGDS